MYRVYCAECGYDVIVHAYSVPEALRLLYENGWDIVSDYGDLYAICDYCTEMYYWCGYYD